ncbi:MAG: hypothetical protein K2Y20_07095 [Sphingomonas sp.]|nr:hypothetical protein [Sphingomonas sp.]
MADNPQSVGLIINRCRQANLQCAALFGQQGVKAIDSAIASALTTFDLLEVAGLPPIEAVEWLRNFADCMEREVMANG